MKIKKAKISKKKQLKLLEQFVAGTTARIRAELADVNIKTAQRYFRKIRTIIALHQENEHNLFDGEVEIDESYFGGKQKGKRGRGAAGKVPVFGLLKRRKKVFTTMIADVKKDTLLPIKKLSYVISLLFLIVHIPYSYSTEASQVLVNHTNKVILDVKVTFGYNPKNNAAPIVYLDLINKNGRLLNQRLKDAFNKDQKEENLFKNYNFDDFCTALPTDSPFYKAGYTHGIEVDRFLLNKELTADDYTKTSHDDLCEKKHTITFMPFSHSLQVLLNYEPVKNKFLDLEENVTTHLLKRAGIYFNLRIHEVTKENNALKKQIKKKDEEIPKQDKTITQQKYIIVLLILLIGVREMLYFYH